MLALAGWLAGFAVRARKAADKRTHGLVVVRMLAAVRQTIFWTGLHDVLRWIGCLVAHAIRVTDGRHSHSVLRCVSPNLAAAGDKKIKDLQENLGYSSACILTSRWPVHNFFLGPIPSLGAGGV